MKKMIYLSITAILCRAHCFAQSPVDDQSIRYQQERMVYKQWDQKKFTPTSGFLGLNPYYWLTWGLFYPNYHKTDIRPLSPGGAQTQRLGLVGTMSDADEKYKLQSDTLGNTALQAIANYAGSIAGGDPLWLLYYSKELKPALNYTETSILGGLSPQVSRRLVSEGLYDWYRSELDRLKERIQGTHAANMDRGSRIMAYYRLLNEYRRLSGIWAVRTSSAQNTLDMQKHQQKLNRNVAAVPDWTPQTDIRVAHQVLQHLQ